MGYGLITGQPYAALIRDEADGGAHLADTFQAFVCVETKGEREITTVQ